MLDLFPDFVKKSNGKIYIDYDVTARNLESVAAIRNKTLQTMLGLGYMDKAGTFTTQSTGTPISSSGKYAG